MNQLIIPIAAVIIFTASCTSKQDINKNIYHQQNHIEMIEKDQNEINSLLDNYKKSLITSDAALAQSMYAKDGVFMPQGGPSAIGEENILASYTFIFSQIQLNIEFQIDEIIVDGDMAFARTTSKGNTLIRASQATIPEENRELFVFTKVNGEWKIARYMFNKMS